MIGTTRERDLLVGGPVALVVQSDGTKVTAPIGTPTGTRTGKYVILVL